MSREDEFWLAGDVTAAAHGALPNVAPMTWREACELIAGFLLAEFGHAFTPRQVWESSPTGELGHVHLWARVAAAWQQRCRALPAPSGAAAGPVHVNRGE